MTEGDDAPSTASVVYDLVVRGGRVLDPETGLDQIADVAVTGNKITNVSISPLMARKELDATGLVVSPGFIDMHSHSTSILGLRLQAHDGVTTALDLESGKYPVSIEYQRAAAMGRPINYGFSASWTRARMVCVGGLKLPDPSRDLDFIDNPTWQRPASQDEVRRLTDVLRDQLADGALGIGILVGYAPEIEHSEYLAVSALAAAAGASTFTHARGLIEADPDLLIDGAQEIVHAAAATGVHAHFCHVNSTSLREIDRVLALVDRVRFEGGRISTEAYPYGAGMTAIGAHFLHPDRLSTFGLAPSDVVPLATGIRMRTLSDLERMRASDPMGWALLHYLDESDERDQGFLDRALIHETTVVGSDAIPLTWIDGKPDELEWPPPRRVVTHPRTAGTFSKFLRRYVRELGALNLAEALRRCTLQPARLLGNYVPDMRSKGRLQPGCDADIVAFDPSTVSDMATYDDPARPSSGFAHVVVGGTPLIEDHRLRLDVLPGRPVRV